MAKRASGAKLFFYTLVSNGAKVQVMADARCVFCGTALLCALL